VRSAWTETTRRRVLFGALALCWLLLGVFGLLALPAFVAVVALGLLALKTLPPDDSAPNRTVVASRWNVALGFVALAAFVPLAAGPGLLLGTMDVDLVLTLAGVLSAVVLALALAVETRDGARPAPLGKRELVLALTALLAFVASYHAGDLFLAMVALAVVLPIVLVVQRVRLARRGELELALVRRPPYAAQAANVWLFAALLGVASLPGTFALYELMFPDAHRTIRRVRTGHRPRRRLGKLGRAAPAHPGAGLADVRDRRRRPRDVPDPLPRHGRDPRRRRTRTDERGRPPGR
jgi:hypothetical protein